MIPPGYPAAAQPPVVRPLWSLIGPALGALHAAGLLTAPVGRLGGAIQRDLGLSTTAIAMTVVAPYVVATAAMVAPGYLLGRRWPTATGMPALAILAVGSLLNGLAPGPALIAIGQVAAGLGAGTVVGVVLALSAQLGQRRSQVRLALGIALGVALLIAPVVSGTLASALSWRWVFLFDVPVAVVALAGTGVTGIAMWVRRQSPPGPPAAPGTAPSVPGETPFGGPTR